MPRLSIVIPALGDFKDLESTLVSVLSQRPEQCEVLVVLNRPYADPYELTDEVRFVEARAGTGWAELVAAGFAASQAPLVHVLETGVEVTDEWAAPAIAHFSDPRVVAVSPLVLDRDNTQHVVATSLAYASGGRRTIAGAGLDAVTAARAAGTVLGPTRLAGFYRKSLVDGILGGIDRTAGDGFADADLGLRAQHAGLRSLFEPRCRVLAPAAALANDQGIGNAYYSERLFWRYWPLGGGAANMLRHLALVAGDFVHRLPSPGAFAALVARTLALFDVGGHRRHHQRLRQIRHAAQDAVQRVANELRIDRSHTTRRVRVRMHRGVRPSAAHHDA